MPDGVITDSILGAETADGFEAAVTSMLHEVHSSGLGLLGPTTKITPRSAINASFHRVETSGEGTRWVLSYLTPSKVPIGYSLDRQPAERGYDKASLPRFDRIPKSKLEIPFLALKFLGKESVVLETSGLGRQSFHGRVVILVNEHTTGTAEILA